MSSSHEKSGPETLYRRKKGPHIANKLIALSSRHSHKHARIWSVSCSVASLIVLFARMRASLLSISMPNSCMFRERVALNVIGLASMRSMGDMLESFCSPSSEFSSFLRNIVKSGVCFMHRSRLISRWEVVDAVEVGAADADSTVEAAPVGGGGKASVDGVGPAGVTTAEVADAVNAVVNSPVPVSSSSLTSSSSSRSRFCTCAAIPRVEIESAAIDSMWLERKSKTRIMSRTYSKARSFLALCILCMFAAGPE